MVDLGAVILALVISKYQYSLSLANGKWLFWPFSHLFHGTLCYVSPATNTLTAGNEQKMRQEGPNTPFPETNRHGIWHGTHHSTNILCCSDFDI
jgi:hypothetical protein